MCVSKIIYYHSASFCTYTQNSHLGQRLNHSCFTFCAQYQTLELLDSNATMSTNYQSSVWHNLSRSQSRSRLLQSQLLNTQHSFATQTHREWVRKQGLGWWKNKMETGTITIPINNQKEIEFLIPFHKPIFFKSYLEFLIFNIQNNYWHGQ